jgi:hypothetical protein
MLLRRFYMSENPTGEHLLWRRLQTRHIVRHVLAVSYASLVCPDTLWTSLTRQLQIPRKKLQEFSKQTLRRHRIIHLPLASRRPSTHPRRVDRLRSHRHKAMRLDRKLPSNPWHNEQLYNVQPHITGCWLCPTQAMLDAYVTQTIQAGTTGCRGLQAIRIRARDWSTIHAVLKDAKL